MKYIVIECHKGYAVLMDEESRFVNAANLRYTVGQTVTAPVLMENPESERRISFYVTRFAAAAACIALAVSAGSFYYSRNFKTHSTILISAQTNIRMDLNKKGQVLHISGGDLRADELLKNYDGKGKDKVTAANEILDMERSNGYDFEEDGVDLFIKTDADEYDSIKEDFVNGIHDTKINVYEYGTPKPKEPDKPEPPKPDEKAKDEKAPEAPKPAEHDAKAPEAPAQPNEGIQTPEAPSPADAAAPAAPALPAAPEAPKKPETPEAPKTPASDAVKPADKNKNTVKPDDKLESPKPEEQHDTPQAPAESNRYVLKENNGIIEITREAVDKIKPLLPAPAPHVQAAANIEEIREALPEPDGSSLPLADINNEDPQDSLPTPEPLSNVNEEDKKPESTLNILPSLTLPTEKALAAEQSKEVIRDEQHKLPEPEPGPSFPPFPIP